MSRRFWFGLLPVACLAVSLAGCKGCVGGENKTGTEVPPVSTVVCPRVLYADYKTYRSWYAEECNGKWVTLNTTKENEAMCPGASGECVEYTKDKQKVTTSTTTSETYYHDPVLEAGIDKASKTLISIPSGSGGFTVTKLSEVHAYLETSTGGPKVFVMLYRVKVEKASDPSLTRTFGTGVEVTEDPGMGAPVVARGQFTNSGQVCHVLHPATNGERYQIVLDKTTTIGP